MSNKVGKYRAYKAKLYKRVPKLKPTLPKSKAEKAPLRPTTEKRAKLTEDEVRNIRREYRYGTAEGETITELANKYGVSVSTIHNIVKRTSWRNVE